MTHVGASRRLGELTAPEAATLITESSIVVLPFGAVEQHGPHLPVATDLILVEALADAVLDEFGESLDLWGLPAIPYTNSGEHVWSPGTFAHSPETVLAAMRDLGDSLSSLRARRVVLLNGHGGNTSLLGVVCRRLRIDHGLLTFLLHGSLPADHGGTGHPGEDGLGIHGGLAETSMMMHLRPDLVRTDRLVANVPRWLNERPHVKFGGTGFGWVSDDFGPSGVIGDATLADADHGKALFEQAVDYLGEVLADVATFEFPDRAGHDARQ